jgi:hypothetical protein
MADYCGETIGFRLSEKNKTVQVIWKAAGEWFTWGGPKPYPLSESAIPKGAVSSGGMWEFAWAVLDIEDAQLSEKLRKILTSPR